MTTTADELSGAKKEHRKWRAIALVSLALVVCLVGVNAYFGIRFFNQPKMVEAKSDLDPAVLALTNDACKIISPSGERLDGKRQSPIPKGSYLTPECFGASHN